jgi:uncharacterized protein (TIGR00369 family)
MDLQLDAPAIQQLIREGLPAAAAFGVEVEAVAPGSARIRFPYRDSMLRPGGVISGPTLMAAADTAMYACVLAHLGPELMAVTSEMNLRFLAKTPPADVVAEAQILKLGSRLIVMEVRIADAKGRLSCHVTGTYARP